MSDSLISIVAVCFNSASIIKDTIENILIDGNSTDDTLVIIK